SDELQRMGMDPEDAPGRQPGSKYQVNDSYVEQDVADAVGFTHRHLRSRGVVPKRVQSTFVPFDTGKCSVLFQFYVEKPPAALIDDEWDLFGALEEAELPAEMAGTVT